MTREFLKNLGLDDETVDRVLDENMADIGKEKARSEASKEALEAAQVELEELKGQSGDISAVRQQLSELQAKYDADTQTLKQSLNERDYADAVNRAIADRGLSFSSKSAERAFRAALAESGLELKNGELKGLDDFIKAQREADPDAFINGAVRVSLSVSPDDGRDTVPTTLVGALHERYEKKG